MFFVSTHGEHTCYAHQLLTGKNDTIIKAEVIQWPISHDGISINAG